RRLERHEEQTQERGLARARGAAQELEGPLGQMERDVTEDLRTHAVSQTYVLEANHRQDLRFAASLRRQMRNRPSGAMVNHRLIAARHNPVSTHLGLARKDGR